MENSLTLAFIRGRFYYLYALLLLNVRITRDMCTVSGWLIKIFSTSIGEMPFISKEMSFIIICFCIEMPMTD